MNTSSCISVAVLAAVLIPSPSSQHAVAEEAVTATSSLTYDQLLARITELEQELEEAKRYRIEPPPWQSLSRICRIKANTIKEGEWMTTMYDEPIVIAGRRLMFLGTDPSCNGLIVRYENLNESDENPSPFRIALRKHRDHPGNRLAGNAELSGYTFFVAYTGTTKPDKDGRRYKVCRLAAYLRPDLEEE